MYERHESTWLLTRDQLQALSEASTFVLPIFIVEVPAEFHLFFFFVGVEPSKGIPPFLLEQFRDLSSAIHLWPMVTA